MIMWGWCKIRIFYREKGGCKVKKELKILKIKLAVIEVYRNDVKRNYDIEED